MAVIPPGFVDCVVAIGVPAGKGEISWVASGLFYGCVRSRDKASGEPSSYGVYLVTNKHVLGGLNKAYIRINPEAEATAQTYELQLIGPDDKPLWKGHRVKRVDVAAIPVNYQRLIDEGMKAKMFCNDKHTYPVLALRERGVFEGDPVFVLGFPMGLVGRQRNSVILRGGVIARLRDTLRNPNSEFLVDSTVFPGNSGGPIVLSPYSMPIEGTPAQKSAALIGIIAGYVSYPDVAVSQQTGRARVVFEENSGLAQAFSVDTIDDVVKSFERQITGSKRLASARRILHPKDKKLDGGDEHAA